jgi:hypothetical protein
MEETCFSHGGLLAVALVKENQGESIPVSIHFV